MMKFLYVILCLSFVLLCAQPTTAASTLAATVNIQNATLISQEGHSVQLSFKLSNREGVQSGVRYGIRLIPKEGGAPIDEFFYAESLILNEQETISRDITYHAPDALSGTYQLLLVAINENGFPFSIVSSGTVTFTTSTGVSIDPVSCKLSFTDGIPVTGSSTKEVILTSTKQLSLSCMVKNLSKTAVTVTPSFETYKGGAYGPIVDGGNSESAPLTIEAQGSKLVTVVLPRTSVAGSYVVQTRLRTFEGINSNTIATTYRIPGQTASIVNLSLDKQSYIQGDTATASLVWNAVGESELSLVAELSSNKARCAAPITQALSAQTETGFLASVSFPVTKSCENPTLHVSLLDTNGAVLDTDTTSFTTTEETNTQHTKVIVLIAVLLVCCSVIGIWWKSRRLRSMHTGPLVLFFALALVGSALFPKEAVADTYAASVADTAGNVQGMIFSTVTIDNSTYAPSGQILVSSSISSNVPLIIPVTFTVTTSGNAVVSLLSPKSSQYELAPYETLVTSSATQSPKYLTAPSTAGTYTVDFSTGVVPVPRVVDVSCKSTPIAFSGGSYSYDCDVTLNAPAPAEFNVQVPVRIHIDAPSNTYFSPSCPGYNPSTEVCWGGLGGAIQLERTITINSGSTKASLQYATYYIETAIGLDGFHCLDDAAIDRYVVASSVNLCSSN